MISNILEGNTRQIEVNMEWFFELIDGLYKEGAHMAAMNLDGIIEEILEDMDSVGAENCEGEESTDFGIEDYEVCDTEPVTIDYYEPWHLNNQ